MENMNLMNVIAESRGLEKSGYLNLYSKEFDNLIIPELGIKTRALSYSDHSPSKVYFLVDRDKYSEFYDLMNEKGIWFTKEWFLD